MDNCPSAIFHFPSAIPILPMLISRNDCRPLCNRVTSRHGNFAPSQRNDRHAMKDKHCTRSTRDKFRVVVLTAHVLIAGLIYHQGLAQAWISRIGSGLFWGAVISPNCTELVTY